MFPDYISGFNAAGQAKIIKSVKKLASYSDPA
jgi:hypothetical protein